MYALTGILGTERPARAFRPLPQTLVSPAPGSRTLTPPNLRLTHPIFPRLALSKTGGFDCTSSILISPGGRFYMTNFTLVATSTGGGIAYMNGTVGTHSGIDGIVPSFAFL